MRHLRRALIGILAAVGLFLAYLRMARAVTVNSDGASNALQAWDVFHGNVLLRGWTLSDVSFYPTELIQYGLIQIVTGLTTDQIHIAGALTWTLVVLAAAWLAASVALAPDAPRWSRWVAAAVAVALLLVPAPGVGYQTLLSSPNHTGSAVPLLLAWLLVDRARDRAWLPYAVAVVLAWGAMGDPLITFVGAVPLVAVTALRALRARDLRGADARLALAGIVSVLLSHGVLWLVERAGGFRAPHPPIELSPVVQWPQRAQTVSRMVSILYGTSRPGIQSPWVEALLQAVRVPGLILAAAALALTVVAVLRGTADRVDAVLAAAIICDLVAEIVSTLPIDALATREIAPVLPMSAVLAARVTTRLLSAVSRVRMARAGLALLTVVLVAQLAALVAYAPPRAEPIEGQEAADWLRGQGLRYGLGSYWVSNNITVGTSRKVTVVPTLSGGGRLVGMCWQTHTDMYDATAHDARFVVLEKQRPMYGTPADVTAQYGPPVMRHDFNLYVIFVYDRNLLEGFTSTC
ncbi:hypothetical protein [Dactylosporangium sp. CA-233914]|uniref:hypothetical protein n=1 Tax=Dactylosporangium sp. CA-233914 TaxID=3239934 RepID=UPI003D8FF24C